MKLIILSGVEVIKILSKAGFKKLDQHGSHVIMIKETDGKKLKPVVPLHKELAKGTLLSIIKQAGMTKEEFIRSYYGR